MAKITQAIGLPLSFVFLVITPAHASDIASDVRQYTDSRQGNNSYFEIGLQANYHEQLFDTLSGKPENDAEIGLSFSGAYYYKRLFLEAAQGSYDGLSLGVQLINTDVWALDLLASSLSARFIDDDPDNTNKTKDQILLERENWYNGAGLRLTTYVNEYVLQAKVVSDIYDDNGLTASLRLGRSWPWRNGSVHAIGSIDYASSDTVAYQVGVTEAEATERFGVYSPGAGLAYSVEIGTTFPLTERIVWQAAGRFTQLSDEYGDSPLLVDDEAASIRTSISYVF